MAIKSTGTTFSLNGVIVGKLSSISEISCDSSMIDVTTLDHTDGYRHYIQGAKDAGEVRLTGFHEKNQAGQSQLRALYESGEAASAVISFPDGMSASFPALVKSHALGAAQVDGAIGFVCVLKPTGKVEIS